MNNGYSKYFKRIVKENAIKDAPWWVNRYLFNENSSMVYNKNAAYTQNVKMNNLEQQKLNQMINQNIKQNSFADDQEAAVNNDMSNETDLDNNSIEDIQPITTGKIYYLKKLYNKFISLKRILDNINNDQLKRLKFQVTEAKDMFEFIVQNFEQYNDRLDDIIYTFENFILLSSSKINKIIKANSTKS